MDFILMHWDIIQKILLNTILVSFPEELYILMFTLILVGEFDYWMEDECKKLINTWDYSRILIPTITVSLLSNIMRYTGWDFAMGSFIPVIVFYILIVLTNDVLKEASALKWMSKTLVFFVIALITLGISELIYAPLIIYGTGKSIEEINSNILSNFLISLPSRVIQYTILLYLILKKRTLLKGNIFAYIFESKFLSSLTALITIFNLFFLYCSYKFIIYDKILTNIQPASQLFIIIGIILLPLFNISIFLWGLYHIKNNDILERKNICQRLENLSNDIKIYINDGNYDNIKWKLNEIDMVIDEVTKNLYYKKLL